jgi:hypothetical protein
MKNNQQYFVFFRKLLRSGIPRKVLINLTAAVFKKYKADVLSLEGIILSYDSIDIWIYPDECIYSSYFPGTKSAFSLIFQSCSFIVWFSSDFSSVSISSLIGIGTRLYSRGKKGRINRKSRKKQNKFLSNNLTV